jgi:hypothetical protein
MKRVSIVLGIILITLCLSGCYTIQWCNIHPNWNPSQGQDWAQAQCNSQSMRAGGYDWIDVSLNKVNSYNACMASYGYEQRKIVNQKKNESNIMIY